MRGAGALQRRGSQCRSCLTAPGPSTAPARDPCGSWMSTALWEAGRSQVRMSQAHLHKALAAVCQVPLSSMKPEPCAGCTACPVRSHQAVGCVRGMQRVAALYRLPQRKTNHQLAVQLWYVRPCPGSHKPLSRLHACHAEQDRMGRAALDAAWARAAKVERSPVFRQKNPEFDIRNPEPYDRCAAPQGTALRGCQSSGSAAAQMCATFPLHVLAGHVTTTFCLFTSGRVIAMLSCWSAAMQLGVMPPRSAHCRCMLECLLPASLPHAVASMRRVSCSQA